VSQAASLICLVPSTAMPFESFQTIASHNVDPHSRTANAGHKIRNPNYLLFMHHARGYALHVIGILTLLARIIYDGSSRNLAVALRDGHAESRGSEAYLNSTSKG
jgi:hypothetical protein